MTKAIEQLDNPQLNARLAEWLETSPLYTEYCYFGNSNLQVLPDFIHLFCHQCERGTNWRNQANRNQVGTDKSPLQQRSYRCDNCKAQLIHFCYSWNQESEKTAEGQPVSMFRKYGQWPPIEERVPKELEKALEGTDDLKFYTTALRLRNFGTGIGAMLYMRRVIENHMNKMIDILKEEAADDVKFTEIAQQEIPSTFRDKVDYAGKLFPADITPENLPNPMKPLYLLSSDAIHNLPESEAVTLFDQCRVVFEFVFSKLRPALKDRRDFRIGLQTLARLSTNRAK